MEWEYVTTVAVVGGLGLVLIGVAAWDKVVGAWQSFGTRSAFVGMLREWAIYAAILLKILKLACSICWLK